MGAPKQKWTAEEEAALKAGIAKYGVGKWSAILKDPEFNVTLQSRSNVDLKDKWRNINVMVNGLGSRQKSRLAYKSTPQISKSDDTSVAPAVLENDPMEVEDFKPVAVSSEASQSLSSKRPVSRLDDLILDAIAKLKEPRGSTRHTIALYIEERYLAPPNFEKLLSVNLKLLTDSGRLIKVKHQYRLAPSPTSFDMREESLPLPLEGKLKDSPKVENNGIKILTKAEIDAELEKMKYMSAEEAAAAAARAVAEAEVAIAEAEGAAREAEDAEAEAEAAHCFAEAAVKALKSKTICA